MASLSLRKPGYETIPDTHRDLEERRACAWKGFCAALTAVALIVIPLNSYFLPASDESQSNVAGLTEDHLVPTRLAVIDPVTKTYLAASQNPLYGDFASASFSYDPPTGDASIVEYPQLQMDRFAIGIREPLTLTWTLGTDVNGEPVLNDDDVIALYCGAEMFEEHFDQSEIIDAATIAQARATSVKNGGTGEQDWFFPSFPVLRQDVCQFVIYKSMTNEEYVFLGSSEALQILNAQSFPTGIHIAYGNDETEMVVQFTTGAEGRPVVAFGLEEATDLELAEGSSDTYFADDMCDAPANVPGPAGYIWPGWQHTVRLNGLETDRLYQYKVGVNHSKGEILWSPTYTFTSAMAPGSEQPFMYIAVADQGGPQPGWGPGAEWVSQMITKEVTRDGYRPRSVHMFGDLSYSDGIGHIWDTWFHMVQPFTARAPFMISVGNHEYDHLSGGVGKDPSGLETPFGFNITGMSLTSSSGGECGVPTSRRFKMPESDDSNGVYWYSYDEGPVHTTVISGEHNLTEGSIQYAFLKKDLESVNRTKTPWLVVEIHRPLYVSELGYTFYAYTLVIRAEIEDLLYANKVDIVLSGHYHIYFRTCDGLYNQTCGVGGPLYLTIGTAGAYLFYQLLYEYDWAARFIYGYFGYARMNVYNASALYLEFVQMAEEDDFDSAIVGDKFWVLRDR